MSAESQKSEEMTQEGLTGTIRSVTDMVILGVVRPGICSNCLVAKVQAKGRCSTCGDYYRRTGRERPEELIVRQGRRIIDREVARRAS